MLMNVEDRLFAEGCAFDFFQAVRVLARLDPRAGRSARPGRRATRWCASAPTCR